MVASDGRDARPRCRHSSTRAAAPVPPRRGPRRASARPPPRRRCGWRCSLGEGGRAPRPSAPLPKRAAIVMAAAAARRRRRRHPTGRPRRGAHAAGQGVTAAGAARSPPPHTPLVARRHQQQRRRQRRAALAVRAVDVGPTPQPPPWLAGRRPPRLVGRAARAVCWWRPRERGALQYRRAGCRATAERRGRCVHVGCRGARVGLLAIVPRGVAAAADPPRLVRYPPVPDLFHVVALGAGLRACSQTASRRFRPLPWCVPPLPPTPHPFAAPKTAPPPVAPPPPPSPHDGIP